jgi:ribosomal protein S18 acetylase RimI-like enzyme
MVTCQTSGVETVTAIRLAREADVPALSALAGRTWAEAFGGSLSPEDLAAELEATRSESYFRSALRRDTILVAEMNGELVGYAQLGDVTIPEVEVQPGDQALHRVYVDPRLQGRGIGRALVDRALAHPRLGSAPRVYLTVWEENEPALRLSESVGFRRIGTTRVTIAGADVGEDLVMVLERSTP